eukprot:102255_1
MTAYEMLRSDWSSDVCSYALFFFVEVLYIILVFSAMADKLPPHPKKLKTLPQPPPNFVPSTKEDEYSQSLSGTDDAAFHAIVSPSNTQTFNDDQKAATMDGIRQPPESASNEPDMIITQVTTFDDEMKYYQNSQEIMALNDHEQQSSSSMLGRSARSPKHKLKQNRSLKRIFAKIKGRDRKAPSELPSYATFCKFAWEDLNVFVGSGKKKKQILFDMNGSISSGQLMAIMGGSGAGKSTLLNILSGRTNLSQQLVSGTLSINQKSFSVSDQSVIKALCSFVPQSDVLCSTQTVREALMFYANLKLSHTTPEKQKKRINYLMRVLHLAKCANNMIGDMNESSGKKGISGGERRRVSIAAEIINEVDIIFLDEPTSGLDAYTASATIKTLKEFCTVSNKIIIATIHQPSIETFYLFDKLLLLSRGKCCFNSTVQNIDVFFKHSLRPKTNPADVIVFEIQQNPDQYARQWRQSNLNIEKMVKDKVTTEYEPFTDEDMCHSHNNLNNAPRIQQMRLLLNREFQALYRDKKVSLVRLGQVLFFALITGTIYFDIRDSYSKKSAAFFLLSIIPILFGMVSLLVVFPKQKVLFQREYNSNTYSMFIFALSFILIEIPREIIHMLIFNVITYFLINLDGDFYDYWINLFLCSFSGGSFGMLFGVICATPAESAQMVPAALIPILMFSDGWIPVKGLPEIIRWIAALDPMYFLFRCFMIIEFKGVTYERTLSEEDQYVCDKYGGHKAFWVNGQWNGTNGTLFNCSLPDDYTKYIPPVNLSNIPANITKIIPNPFNVTIDNNSSNFNTTMSEDQQKVEEFCREDIPSSYFFEARELDPNALVRYWMFVLIICLCVRGVALILLYIKSNNQVSFRNVFCVLGKGLYGKCLQCFGGKCQKKSRETKKQQSLGSQIVTQPTMFSMAAQYDTDQDKEMSDQLEEVEEGNEDSSDKDANNEQPNRQETFV